MINIFENVPLEGKKGYRGREGGVSDEREIMRIAVHLADRLSDWKSLAFFRLVAQHVPEPVIQKALTAALDIPKGEVRRSRAAYFTAIVRPHLPARRSSPPPPAPQDS